MITTYRVMLISALLFCLMPNSGHALVILQYHHIATDTPFSTSTKPETFAAHLEHLAQSGFKVVALSEHLAQSKAGDAEANALEVAITFDDAYRSIFTEAFPLLRARGWPFTIFVATRLIEEGNPNYLTWANLKKMSMHGATIANHTDSHIHMIRRLEAETGDRWENRIRAELITAKGLLVEHGLDSNLFAYPYGEYDAETLNPVSYTHLTLPTKRIV